MKQLYTIRHGNHNWSELTDYGIAQVIDLYQKIEPRLPRDAKYKLISSPSERTYDTAKKLQHLLKRGLGLELNIEKENAFGQFEGGIGMYGGAIDYGKKVIPLIETYFKENDIVLIAAHKECIGSMSIALPVHYEIPFSDTLKPVIWWPDDEGLISMVMEDQDLEREEALQWIVDEYPEYFLHNPSIPEASAAFFDLEAKVCELIYCGLRSMG